MTKEEKVKIRNIKIFLLSTGVYFLFYAFMLYFNRLFFSSELVGYPKTILWETEELWAVASINVVNLIFKYCTCLFFSVLIILVLYLKAFKEKMYVENVRLYAGLAFIVPTILFTLVLLIPSDGTLAPFDVLAQFDSMVDFFTDYYDGDRKEALSQSKELLNNEIFARKLMLLITGLVSLGSSIFVNYKYKTNKS